MVAPVIAAAGIGALGDLAGGLVDQYFNQKAVDQAWKRQKKVLQNQVQWRVADAVAAGLHPLAALGVNPASGPAATVGSSMGSALSSMGQNLGRAAEAYLQPKDKLAARMALAQVETAEANRDLVRSQVAGSNKALLTQGATPGVASSLPEATPPNMLTFKSNSGKIIKVASPPGTRADPLESDIGEASDWLQIPRAMEVVKAYLSQIPFYENPANYSPYTARAPNRSWVYSKRRY